MRNFILFSFIFIVIGLPACTERQAPTPTKFVTNDSTLLFTFVKDSLYVDTYESGCGIEQYRLEKEFSDGNETIYKAYLSVLGENTDEKIELHGVMLSKAFGAHWEYYIKFDDEEKIPIIKIH